MLKNAARRRFVKQGAGLTFGFALAGLSACDKPDAVQPIHSSLQDIYTPNIWVNIAVDGSIRIYSPAEELGQGSMTALPLIFAEELDANWDDINIEMSPVDDELYGNPKFMGALYTISSNSVTGYYTSMRLHGAQARRVLMDNVAKRWQVSPGELTTEPSRVVHKHGGQSISYGEIAAFATLPDKLPGILPGDLKSPANFRLIGHSVPRRDVPAKVLGTSPYSINESPQGLVYAVAIRSPIMGARPHKVDDSAAKQVPGVSDVFIRESSVCVVADNYYSAVQGRSKLNIEWSRIGKVNEFDSDRAMQEHVDIANDLERKGMVYHQQGDLDSGLSAGNRIISGQYQSDYVYHAQIEPLNATVWVKNGGKSVEAWAGTQAAGTSVRAIAKATGIAPADITLHRAMVGGGFGRRSIQEMDYIDDAAWLSAQLGKPVKVIWTREDDFSAGWFKPMTAHLLRASARADGKITAWHHRVAVQEPLATAEPYIYEQLEHEPVVAMPGTRHHTYEFPNQLAEHLDIQPGIRTYTVLGVGWTPNLFAVEGFMDELAVELGMDAVEFRLLQLEHSGRGKKVLLAAAEMAGWGKPCAEGRALGIAFADYHHTLVAGAAEISLQGNKIIVHDFWITVDPGVAVQPDNIEDQMTGGVMFGLGNALSERISIRKGLVEQSNFHDYKVPRMSDAPNIHVKIMANGEEPTGVGQTASVLVAPAIASAFHRLTGKRLRHMPFIPERVGAALAS